MLKKTASFLKENDRFLILTHRRPDGDTVGSASALCLLLRRIGKTAYVQNSGFTPHLAPFVQDCLAPRAYEPDTVVAVDIADEGLLTDAAKKYAGKIDLCIDHHPSNTSYAGLTFLRADASAAGVAVWELAAELGVTPDAAFARCIYLAVSTDTGCFLFSNTDPQTLRIAAACMETGIDFSTINTEFFEIKSPARIAVETEIFNNLTVCSEGKICCTTLSRGFIEKTGANDDDLNSLSSLLMQMRGVVCGVLLTENTDKTSYKISARSRAPFDVGKLCERFGGGGHARAAGGNIAGELEDCKARVIAAAQEELKNV